VTWKYLGLENCFSALQIFQLCPASPSGSCPVHGVSIFRKLRVNPVLQQSGRQPMSSRIPPRGELLTSRTWFHPCLFDMTSPDYSGGMSYSNMQLQVSKNNRHPTIAKSTSVNLSQRTTIILGATWGLRFATQDIGSNTRFPAVKLFVSNHATGRGEHKMLMPRKIAGLQLTALYFGSSRFTGGFGL
jgi:hypothetical protein